KRLDVRAPLLVWAQVANWSPEPIPSAVRTLSDLARFVAGAARTAGLGTSAALPFRVTAHADRIGMHIVNRQGREMRGMEDHEKIQVRVPVADADVELIGFWSDHHQGVFTHMGSNVHVHGRTTDGGHLGHVDDIEIRSGRLWLPAGGPG